MPPEVHPEDDERTDEGRHTTTRICALGRAVLGRRHARCPRTQTRSIALVQRRARAARPGTARPSRPEAAAVGLDATGAPRRSTVAGHSASSVAAVACSSSSTSTGRCFVSDDPLVGGRPATRSRRSTGCASPDGAMSRVDHAGRTVALDHAPRCCASKACSDDEITARPRPVVRGRVGALPRAGSRRPTRAAGASPPGTAEALERIPAFARSRCSPATRSRSPGRGWSGSGSTASSRRGQGAFGCEADERPELIALARQRAGDWPAERSVEVGDTPRDVEGAKAAGVLSVAVLLWPVPARGARRRGRVRRLDGRAARGAATPRRAPWLDSPR